jgi:hypothetical protein
MSQIEELAPQYGQSVDVADAKTGGRRRFDWPVLVVALAFGCTLAWTCLLFWLVVYACQAVFF